jgi:hypothetical protein
MQKAANSVAIRAKYALTYQPGDLKVTSGDGDMDGGYSVGNVAN